MRVVATIIRSILLLVVLTIIGWAFFDMGWRFFQHRQQLALRPVELTVMHWGEPAEDKIVDDLVQRFEKENPTVRIVRINAGGGFRTKLKTMMAAEVAPDVFYLPPEFVPEMAQQQLIAPLDQYFSKEPAEWRDDFYPLLLDGCRFDTTTNELGKGKLYGLPKDFSTSVFYINKDLFDKAGIDWQAIQKNGWNWDQFEVEMKKIRALNGTPPFAGREIYGAMLQIWPDSLRNMLWTYDGEFFEKKPDGTTDFNDLGFDQPGSIKAMDLITRMRLKDRTAFNATGVAKDGGAEFKAGNIGCVGPVGRWYVPQLKDPKSIKWDVLPVPAGSTRASQMFYNGWAMSAKSKHPDEAYRLIRFLCGREGQVQQGRAGLAIPALKSVANSPDFLEPEGIPKHDSQQFIDAIQHARIGQLPRQTEFTRMVEQTTNEAIQTGRRTPTEAADVLQAKWTSELNSPLRQKQWPAMPWATILSIAAAVLATVTALLWWNAKREKLGPLDRAGQRAGFMFILPWVIGFLLLTLGPMVASMLLAFSRWSGVVPINEAQFVGATNFRQLFTHDSTFLQSLKVTAYYVLLGVPLSQIAALAIAVLMNSNVRGIALFRTIYFVPSVVSGVALSVLWLQLFNDQYGLINAVLRGVLKPIGLSTTVAAILLALVGVALLWGLVRSTRRGADAPPTASLLPGVMLGAGLMLLIVGIVAMTRGVAGPNPPNWFGVDTETSVNDAARWAVPGFVIMSLWGVGGGMIIYLAGLKGIPGSLYEAARIDGAGPARQFWNVTLPMLSPLIFYNLVMAIIGSFQVFTQAYTMTGAGPENSTLFYVLQLYYQAFEFHNMGYASAMAWVLFLIVLVLTVIVFRGSKSLVYYEGLKT